MTDPTSANRVLVALAERASKRRSQYKKEESKEILDDTQPIQESLSQSEKRPNFKPKKNSNQLQQSIKEEFPPSLESEEEFQDNYSDSDYEEVPVPVKISKRVSTSLGNNFEGNVPLRPTRKNPRVLNRFKNFNPENAKTFEEQVDLVGNLLCDKLSAFQSIPALRVTQEWIDCIVDENDSLYEEIYKKLMLLNKEHLLGYIRILVSALK